MVRPTEPTIPRADEHIDPSVVFPSVIELFHEYSPVLATGLCPFHPDQLGCLRMNLLSRRYYCEEPTCNAAGSNVVRFMAAYLGISAAKARKCLARNYGDDVRAVSTDSSISL